jgi:hypothetical protein
VAANGRADGRDGPGEQGGFDAGLILSRINNCPDDFPSLIFLKFSLAAGVSSWTPR